MNISGNPIQSHSKQNSMGLAQKQTHRSAEWKDSPEINPHTCGQLIYNRRGKNMQWGKSCLVNKSCWENWTATCKTMTLKNCITRLNYKFTVEPQNSWKKTQATHS